MRIAEVVGRVTLARAHPNLPHPTLLIVLPMPREALLGQSAKRGEDLVAYDPLGAGRGALVAISEGREAANPFGKTPVPVDAYCACLLDRVDL